MMIFEIAGDRARRMMRTVPDVIDHGALGCKFGAHPFMQRIDLVFGEVTARHAGLVGEEEHEIANLVEALDCPCCIGHPANPLACSDIAVVPVDDTVAVEKGRGFLVQLPAHGWPVCTSTL
jgi:hypothetical protein